MKVTTQLNLFLKKAYEIYACPVCNKEYKMIARMKRHISEHNNDQCGVNL
jgi:predicted RNA-binding Zn-ribbon protein involved in translation (DUF1610 family)